jgi:succinoglycan biosynthesis protein ExoM
MASQAAAAAPSIDVCVCTFQRPSLRETLASLAAQQGAAPFRVIVSDNDETPSAEGLVAWARRELGLEIVYVHAPARNISVARNACLDRAEAELAAFVDDDEIAPPAWLATIAAYLADRQFDVVFGPVKAVYPVNAPRWARAGDFHSFQTIERNGAVDTGYSSNVIFKRAVVGARRFDLALGRSGGEDAFFFATLHHHGARLGLCADAVLREPAPNQRLRLAWLVKRAFRSGQTHARIACELRGGSRAALAALAAVKAGYCALGALLTLWSPVRWRGNVIRGALHAGVIARALGARDLELYGGPARTAETR